MAIPNKILASEISKEAILNYDVVQYKDFPSDLRVREDKYLFSGWNWLREEMELTVITSPSHKAPHAPLLSPLFGNFLPLTFGKFGMTLMQLVKHKIKFFKKN